jgi:Flp pilus assembly protein TadG
MNNMHRRQQLAGRIPESDTDRRRGQSLVEFAMILPAFLLVLAGILDFGFMLYGRMTLINATREGARWAVPQNSVYAIPTTIQSSTGPIGSNLAPLQWADLTAISITCVPAQGASACDFVAGGQRDATTGDSIRVATTYTYRSLLARFFGSTIPISAQVQMVLEVPSS